MYCWSCGAKNSDSFVHCTACGKSLRPQAGGGDAGRDDDEFIDLTAGVEFPSIELYEQTTQAAKSLSPEELDPETREQVIRLLRDGAVSGSVGKTTRIRIRGADGKVHVYNSLEELPPEHRALRDRVLKSFSGAGDDPFAQNERPEARVRSIRSSSDDSRHDVDVDDGGVVTRSRGDGGFAKLMMWGLGVAVPAACMLWGFLTLRGTRMFGYFDFLDTPAEEVRERFGVMASGVLIMAAGALAHLQFVWAKFDILARLRWQFMIPLFALTLACIAVILKTAT